MFPPPLCQSQMDFPLSKSPTPHGNSCVAPLSFDQQSLSKYHVQEFLEPNCLQVPLQVIQHRAHLRCDPNGISARIFAPLGDVQKLQQSIGWNPSRILQIAKLRYSLSMLRFGSETAI